MNKNPKEMNEIELYCAIDAIGAYIWRMTHEMGRGHIPKKSWSSIEKSISKMEKLQLEIIAELPRIGVVKPLNETNHGTEEYWKWFRNWDGWKKDLSEEDWREFDAAVTRGLTEEEIKKYKVKAFNKM